MPTPNDLPTDVDELHKMIGELRKEAAGHRTKGKPYADAFEGYSPQEVSYLLDIVNTLRDDPESGASKVRDMAFGLYGREPEKFAEGLYEVPAAPEKKTDEGQKPEESTDMAELTLDDIKQLLDEREAANQQTQAQAAEDAEIQAVFAEVTEATGFKQGTPEFGMALQLAAAKGQLTGEAPDFKAIAPLAAQAVGTEWKDPAASGEGEEKTDEQAESSESDDGEPDFVSTPEAGGSGRTGTPEKGDWVAEANEGGRDLWEVARERMEARLEDA